LERRQDLLATLTVGRDLVRVAADEVAAALDPDLLHLQAGAHLA